MKVRVQDGRTGYFKHLRRRSGDVFIIPDEPRRKVRHKDEVVEERLLPNGQPGKVIARADDAATLAIADKKGTVPVAWSSRWMEVAEADAPVRVTSAPEALKRHHDTLLAERAGAATGDAEVI
jgi:hypothetical protein